MGHAGQVHDGAGASAVGKAWFFDWGAEAVEPQVGLYAIGDIIHLQAQLLQRLDDLQRDRADLQIHALAAKMSGGKYPVLHTVLLHHEVRVHQIQVGIDTKRCTDHGALFGVIALKVVSVVEVAVGACGGDGLGQLVNGKVVG